MKSLAIFAAIKIRGNGADSATSKHAAYEVEVQAKASANQTIGRPGSCSVPTPVSPSWTGWAAAGELGKFAFIHLATHGVIDDSIPVRSAVILTQTGLPDPLTQALSHQPVYDGQLIVRERSNAAGT